nr:NAD-dependent epimerase/dehydratase family protein [Clostridium sp. Marseille-P299]
MKHILITGENSYIGNSFLKYMNKYNEEHQNHEVCNIDFISVRDDRWRKKDFSKYDAILHVAGIVHQRSKNNMLNIYKKVNIDLTLEIAKKAKENGTKQFIFLSSMSVYGMKNGIITRDTIPTPNSYYGWSKLEAEIGLQKMEDENFRIAIVRPPMVYGRGCKGNYVKLSKFAKILPFFPEVSNQRSMIYIDNLCEFIRVLITKQKNGLFYPQNEEYVCTSEMCYLIARVKGKKMHQVRGISNIVIKFTEKNRFLNKIFGNLIYEHSMSILENTPYCVENFLNSIRKTEDINEEGITDYNS